MMTSKSSFEINWPLASVKRLLLEYTFIFSVLNLMTQLNQLNQGQILEGLKNAVRVCRVFLTRFERVIHQIFDKSLD